MPDEGVLQVLPKGLLGFLELKNGGSFPTALLRDLAPTIELLDWYTEANSEVVSGGTVAVAGAAGSRTVGGTLDFAPGNAVPSNEWWLLHEYNVDLITGAGETIQATPAVSFGPAPLSFAVGEYVNQVASENRRLRMDRGRKLFLPPFSGFFIHCPVAVVGTVDATAHVRFSRLRN